MYLTFVIIGVIIMIVGLLRHMKIQGIPRLGYHLVEIPGYLVIALGALFALLGIFIL
jgi:uncharacterized membrane protein YidH (DUF202 family)